jgi:hypothetical protein
MFIFAGLLGLNRSNLYNTETLCFSILYCCIFYIHGASNNYCALNNFAEVVGLGIVMKELKLIWESKDIVLI